MFLTPQEKAVELITFFQKGLIDVIYYEEGSAGNPTITSAFPTQLSAKILSIKVADEIIKEDEVWVRATKQHGGHYWRQVKKELEKLTPT